MGGGKRIWRVGLAMAGVAVAAYLVLCGVLFVEQRSLLFQPPPTGVEDVAGEGGYRPLKVKVAGLGTLSDLWSPPSTPDRPTIVFFHGNGSDRADFSGQGAAFRRLGWGVVLASYRGYSGNPGRPTEAGLMADARATLAAARGRGPLIVWGHSLGSGVAARMASEGRADGLVLESPYTSMTDLAARQYPYVPVGLLLLDRFDTRSVLARIHAPVLIFHSTDDPLIPVAMGQDLADRLGARATFVQLHGLGHYPHQLDLSAAVVAWAKARHLTGENASVEKDRGGATPYMTAN